MTRLIATDKPQNIADGIVFYYSPMCPYCKSVLPLFNDIKNHVPPGTDVYGVDVGGDPGRYDIGTVPAMEYVKDGKVESGVYDSTSFESYINRLCLTARNNYMFC